jgi:hypothetical protein
MKLVWGPTDVAGDAAVTALHAPLRGRLVLSAPLEAATAGATFRAILRAMGKRMSVAPASERTAVELPAARIWLEAYRIRTVIVHQVSRLPAGAIVEVDDVVRAAGGTLYGVAGPDAYHVVAARLGEHVDERIDVDALVSRWPAEASRARESSAVGVPDDLVRINHLRRRIAVAASDRRAPAYLVGVTRAAEFPRPQRPTSGLLAARLRELLAPFADPACFGQAVTGAALAQRPFGWDITLDPLRLAEGVPARPMDAPPGPSLRGFWIFRDPLPGAVWALTRLPVTLDEVLDLRVSDVLETGAMVSVAGEWYRMAAAARPLLRAQGIGRRLEGAGPDDPFIARPGGRPRSPRWLVSVASSAAAEVGVRFLEEELRERPSADERWLLDRGVAIRWTARAERPRSGLTVVELQRQARDVVDALHRCDPTMTCRCLEAHVPMSASDFTGWPPIPARHHVPFDTGARRAAYGRQGSTRQG